MHAAPWATTLASRRRSFLKRRKTVQVNWKLLILPDCSPKLSDEVMSSQLHLFRGPLFKKYVCETSGVQALYKVLRILQKYRRTQSRLLGQTRAKDLSTSLDSRSFDSPGLLAGSIKRHLALLFLKNGVPMELLANVPSIFFKAWEVPYSKIQKGFSTN